jgi:hypothetical protein
MVADGPQRVEQGLMHEFRPAQHAPARTHTRSPVHWLLEVQPEQSTFFAAQISSPSVVGAHKQKQAPQPAGWYSLSWIYPLRFTQMAPCQTLA